MLVVSSEMLDNILDLIAEHGSEEERDWGRKVLQTIACQTHGDDRELYETRLWNQQGMSVQRDITGWGTRVICLGDGLGETVGFDLECTIED
jgi:hypothetical protein